MPEKQTSAGMIAEIQQISQEVKEGKKGKRASERQKILIELGYKLIQSKFSPADFQLVSMYLDELRYLFQHLTELSWSESEKII